MSGRTDLDVILVIVLFAYFAGVGIYVAKAKGRPTEEGLVLGLIAGPFGWLIVAMLPAGPVSKADSTTVVDEVQEEGDEIGRRIAERFQPRPPK
jgi:hypothetical protein